MPSTLHERPLAARLIGPALLGFVLGSALQLQQSVLFPWPVYGCLLLLSGVLYVALKLCVSRARLVLAALALGLLAFGLTGLRATVFLQEALDARLEGRDLVLTGVIAAMPQRNETGLRFRFDVESAQWQGQSVDLPARIELGWYAGAAADAGIDDEMQRQPAAIEAGERWQFTVRLKAPHGASNPHGFDYELWLWEQGVQATGYVRAGPRDPTPLRLTQTGRHPLERARQQVRERIFERVTQGPQAGLIAALVVGDQNAIERADWDVFRATGVAHLMSISGLHVTMFAWLAALAVGGLWRRSERLCLALPAPSAALIGGVLLALAYALFSGWGVPSQRTVLMLASVGLLRLSGKRWPWPQVWLLACAVVVASDPWALLQAGFWLSFVAVGVLFATDDKHEASREPRPARPRAAHMVASPGPCASMERKGAKSAAGPPQGTKAPLGGSAAHIVASVGAMLRTQAVITLALAPLSLLLFGQVSMVGLVANTLAIPWVTLIVTPLAMLGVALPLLWEGAAWAAATLTAYLQLLAALPFATLSVAQAPLWAGLTGLLGGLLLAMPLPRSLRSLGLPLLLPALLWQAPRPAAGQFELLAADVGQGTAVIVRTASHALLYDAGPRFSRDSDAGHRVLVPLLRALDVSLDLLVLSHRDSDHVGGARSVLAMQERADLLSSLDDAHELQAARRARRCEAGQRWRWDGVDFEVLHPRAADYQGAQKSNTLSCTLRISNGAQSALLTGDIEAAQEARLVAEGAPLASTLLLVPHHGSKTSSSSAFLDAVAPRMALVQAGYRNRFAHPAPSVLLRYAERHVPVIDSPHCGAARWESVRARDIQCQRIEATRYWHHHAPG